MAMGPAGGFGIRERMADMRPWRGEQTGSQGPGQAVCGMWSVGWLPVLGLLAWLLVRTAWMCDDAYITFRTVENLLNGLGACWNPPERVQSYTHPLWMLSLTGLVAVTHEFYYTVLGLSIGMTLVATALIPARVARSSGGAILALAVLVFSAAFVDFATSGLETPLSYLLIAVFSCFYFAPGRGLVRLCALTLLASLVLLNRLDLALFVVGPLMLAFWETRSGRAAGVVAAGLTPFMAWEAFSLLYYGFPFPNTAYAKLGGGLTWVELLPHGLRYLLDILVHDPVTAVACAGALAAVAIGRERRETAMATGILLYVVYVVRIGGDFMRGRFLAVPLFVAAILIARCRPQGRSAAWYGAIGITAALGFLATHPPILSGPRFGADASSAITAIRNERYFSYSGTGLCSPDRGTKRTAIARLFASRQEEGAALRQAQNPSVEAVLAAGVKPFYAGPRTYFIDVLALCDPLLARLPVQPGAWVTGHFPRSIPAGYIETLRAGGNLLAEPGIKAYYEHLRLITRGTLWDGTRLKTIVLMNLGKYEHLLSETRAAALP